MNTTNTARDIEALATQIAADAAAESAIIALDKHGHTLYEQALYRRPDLPDAVVGPFGVRTLGAMVDDVVKNLPDAVEIRIILPEIRHVPPRP